MEETYQFNSLIQSFWNSPTTTNDPIRLLAEKQKRLKSTLGDFNHTHFSDITYRVKEAQIRFTNALEALHRDPVVHALFSNVKQAKRYFFEKKERVLAQKSASDLTTLGNDNTAFFHVCVKETQVCMKITSVRLEDGGTTTMQDSIAMKFLSYFSDLLALIATKTTPSGHT